MPHASGARKFDKKGLKCEKLDKWDHSVFDCLAALTAGCFVCFLRSSASTAQFCQCVSTKGENDGKENDVNSQTLPVDVMGRAESAPSREEECNRRHSTLSHSLSLRCPIVCQAEPRLHAHGRTVRDYSAGNTSTSDRQSIEEAQTQRLQMNGRDYENRKHKAENALIILTGPLLLHGLPVHKSLFVYSTADNVVNRVHMQPGYFQRLHQRQASHLVSGERKFQSVQTRGCAEQADSGRIAGGHQVPAATTATTSP